MNSTSVKVVIKDNPLYKKMQKNRQTKVIIGNHKNKTGRNRMRKLYLMNKIPICQANQKVKKKYL